MLIKVTHRIATGNEAEYFEGLERAKKLKNILPHLMDHMKLPKEILKELFQHATNLTQTHSNHQPPPGGLLREGEREMKGTEKQIKWAEEIKATMKPDFDAIRTQFEGNAIATKAIDF